jgi:hypothetical protein
MADEEEYYEEGEGEEEYYEEEEGGEDDADEIQKRMNEMEDEEYIKHYTALLEFFKPKQARVTHAGDDKAPVVINVHSDL